MSYMHAPKDHRHARLFELMRQKHAADILVGRAQGFEVRHVNKEELDEIKRVAARSMSRAN